MSFRDGKLLRSLRRRGFAGTFSYGLELAEYAIRVKLFDALESREQSRFDRKYGVDTRGLEYPPEFQLHPSHEHSHPYEPTPVWVIARAMRRLDLVWERFVFVDFGCGKGKVLLLASRWPFRRIVGIDVFQSLIESAKSNLASYRGTKQCRDFQVVCSDARDFEIPAENAVLFFSNPFAASVMQTVMEKIGDSVARFPRDVFILYYYPTAHETLRALPFLSIVAESPWYRIYKVLPLAAAIPDRTALKERAIAVSPRRI